ncbi:MAG: DUF1501 domain-containing protein [Gemmataceae bacterium]
MFTLQTSRAIRECTGLSRRDFLRIGTVSALGMRWCLADALRAAETHPSDMNCIVLVLVGGPSHLETFDPKPDAPESVRGPFRAIRTTVPSVLFSELLPRLAARAHRLGLIRTVYHDESPIHETGQQLLQTGAFVAEGQALPSLGAWATHTWGSNPAGTPSWVQIPGPIDNTGVAVDHGQSAGLLGPDAEPFALLPEPQAVRQLFDRCWGRRSAEEALLAAGPTEEVSDWDRQVEHMAALGSIDRATQEACARLLSDEARRAFLLAQEPEALRRAYGINLFGQSCLLARRLVEHGVRFVTVNMFDTVYERVTWDCHADGGPLSSTLEDYRRFLCPVLDQAVAALMDDLQQRGLWSRTLVALVGEFGRTPRLNRRGGRDHWTRCWSVAFFGGPVRPGVVVGRSDRSAMEPADDPVPAWRVADTVLAALGLRSAPQYVGGRLSTRALQPVSELFG